MVENKDMRFFMENLETKRKKDKKKFDLLEWRIEPQIFSNFPTHDLNFRQKKIWPSGVENWTPDFQ